METEEDENINKPRQIDNLTQQISHLWRGETV